VVDPATVPATTDSRESSGIVILPAAPIEPVADPDRDETIPVETP